MRVTRTRFVQVVSIVLTLSAGFEGILLNAETAKTDAARSGGLIAAKGSASGAVACARCHGFDGNSDGSGAFPVIAGQSEFYLQKQLRNYASGIRKNAIMGPIAARLTAGDVAAVAGYYSQLPARPVESDQTDPALVQRGKQLSMIGNLAERVEACQSCHGPGGEGESPDIPRLAGQYSHYIATQLQMLRRGYRKNDPGGQMRAPSHNLSEQDILAVGAFFAQAPVPDTLPKGVRHGR